MKDGHVMEALGKTHIVVENGKIVEVEEPMTEYCHIWDKVRAVAGKRKRCLRLDSCEYSEATRTARREAAEATGLSVNEV